MFERFHYIYVLLSDRCGVCAFEDAVGVVGGRCELEGLDGQGC